MDTEFLFPDVHHAHKDGLLAVGGDLSPDCLLTAYRSGIFPWYSPGNPILWWSPNPRCVLFPEKFRLTRSTRKSIRKNAFQFTIDRAFHEVIHKCAAPRASSKGTWITPEMIQAYCQMYDLGHAHSIETWQDQSLVGGLYGIALGRVFFGESMFSTISNASKGALYFLVKLLCSRNYKIIDCQISSSHLLGLGAEEIPRTDFIHILSHAIENDDKMETWDFSADGAYFDSSTL